MKSTRTCKLALLQMSCALGDWRRNFDKAEEMLAPFSGKADIAALPECADTGYAPHDCDWFELAQPVPGPRTDRLSALARNQGMALVAGVLERCTATHGVLYDTVVVIDRTGELVGRYRKTHLYPTEHQWFRAGDTLPVFEVGGVKIGIATCFELAFPGLAATLAKKGVVLLLNPSAVPAGFEYLQDLRVRARAQDNQIFVAAINHVGLEGSTHFCGGTQVADPRGGILARASVTEELVLSATLDFSLVAQERIQEPVFRSMRQDLYR